MFYTDGATVALPTLKSITQIQTTDAGEALGGGITGAVKGGSFNVRVTFSAANIVDSTSVSNWMLSELGALIVASTQFG